MGALPTSDPVAFRFAPYIKELREFLASSHLRYGAPEDIFPVTERLQNSKAFAEDMSSMIRAILLREGGSMAHAQLLEILAIAIGGPAMDHASQDYRQPLRQLLSFLTGVLRRPWNLPPGEEAEPPSPGSIARNEMDSTPLARSPDGTPDRIPDRPEPVAFPSGPFATAAALAAAEQRVAEPKAAQSTYSGPPHRQRNPVEIPAAQTDSESASARIVPTPDAAPAHPEYSEADFAEYEAFESAPPEPAIVEPAFEAAPEEVPPADSEPVLARVTSEAPTPPQFRSNTELIDQVFNPGPLSPKELNQQTVSAPEPAPSTPVPAPLAEPTPASMDTATPLGAAESLPHSPSAPPVDETVATAAIPSMSTASAYEPVTDVAKATQHYMPDLNPWHDSPFDDLDSPEFFLTEPPVQHHADAAAPWISHASNSPDGGMWKSSTRRNLLILTVAAVPVIVYAVLALRNAPPADEASAMSVPQARSSSTAGPAPASLSPQHATDPPAAPAKPTASGNGFTTQPVSVSRLRGSSDEDADYTGSDVAPPRYRSFVASPASSGGGHIDSETAASENQASYNSGQTAPVERRGPGNSLIGGPETAHQSFRNPDATLAGDSRPVRPPPRSLSGEPTFRVSSGLMAANLISAPNPEYPTLARLTHTQGEVILQAVISRDGRVSAAHVLSGHRLLRGAAVDAVKRWRYRPYIADGHPVDVTTVIRVDFRSHN
jgi:TonB family protein